jgi:hypothetical protein
MSIDIDALAEKGVRKITPVTNVVTVDVNRIGSYTPDGSSEYHYTSIKAALDSITNASDTNRFVMHVFPGKYEERITTKAFVYIVGFYADTTFIQQDSGHVVIVPDEGGYASGFKNITIIGLSNESNDSTVFVDDGGSVSFEDCSVLAVSGKGAEVGDGAFLIGHNTSFQSSENDGVVCHSGGSVVLDGGTQSGKDETTWDVSVESGGWMAYSGSLSLMNGRFNKAGDVICRTPV